MAQWCAPMVGRYRTENMRQFKYLMGSAAKPALSGIRRPKGRLLMSGNRQMRFGLVDRVDSPKWT